MTFELDVDMAGFFRGRLVLALDRHGVAVAEATEFYLVNLLIDYAHISPERALGRPLVERLAEALEAESSGDQLRCFRNLGDCALYASGLFADHLARRGINRQYVASMGGRAYEAAGELAPRIAAGESSRAEVYPELASAFDGLTQALSDVRETTALRTPQDIVRLYERWRQTGSPVLAERLQCAGVFPQVPDGKPTLH